jgi:AraC-like DNA-binding protein
MRAATSPADLASDPVDRYWIGKTQLVFCGSPAMCGTITWGSPDSADVRALVQALGLAQHSALASGFAVYMDASGIERVDWQPFSELAIFVRDQLPAWAKVITKQAVIVPSGPAGAMLAGMVPMLGGAFPMKFFDGAADALDWLGWARDASAIATLDEARQLAADARGITPTIHQLRSWLATDLIGPSLESAARSLGTSARTLQRELQSADTSFTAEVQAARVREACRLLAETDEKVEVIARTVGCSTASQLSTLFRKVVGETPAVYRERLTASRTPR